jgi:hypothetical protein
MSGQKRGKRSDTKYRVRNTAKQKPLQASYIWAKLMFLSLLFVSVARCFVQQTKNN